MNNLRQLVLYSFTGGMFFDAFISSLITHHFGNTAIFFVGGIAIMIYSLKFYDKVKVK